MLEINLDRNEKIMVLVWLTWLAFLDGVIEAHAFNFLEYEKHNFPLYYILKIVFFISLLAIIPFLTNKRDDWLIIIGGGFMIQFIQDISHWIARVFFIGDWTIQKGFWTPLWDILGIQFFIPLFWIIDISIFIVFFLLWWILDT